MGKGNPRKKTRQGPKTDLAQCLMEIWIGLFVACYLLFPGLGGYRVISTSKTWSFFALMAPLLGLGIWLLLRDLRNGIHRPWTWSQSAAVGFLLATLASAALSPFGGKAWYNAVAHEAALTVSCYVFLFLIVARWAAPTQRLFRVLFWSMVAFCLLCVLQAAGENPFGLYPGNLSYYDGNEVKYSGAYVGTIGNVDFVSAFLALVTPMFVLRAIGQPWREAWLFWVLAAVCLGIMVWIHVLCGLVGLAVGGVICLAVLCPNRMRKWILLAMGIMIAAVLAILWWVDMPIKLFHELHEILHGRFQDSFGTSRFYIWRQLLERIPQRLLFGVGPDAARSSNLSPFVRMIPKPTQLFLPEYESSIWIIVPKLKIANITDAHCYPLQILYCQGLPALLSWLVLVFGSLIHWIEHREDRAVAILGGGLICFLCAMLFCPSSIILMPFFWLALALLEARRTKIR